ncbi:MAG: hypothetical protein CTR55_20040 [Pseudomonas sp.]|uniref:hypothetical protein n=1 Tax=Pseudomonas sp. TaxID=306 RepID=UPI000CB5CB25|nr:hypothetical protein [Pseudomonas sp.]PJI47245.1 MAG: hypothetical protein CTR55_20040 [Pseudomonas sp.]
MSETSQFIVFAVTQLALPFGLGYLYCRRKGIPTDTWRAGGIYLIALSLAMLVFIGLLGLPTHVKNVGMVSNRSMGLLLGVVGIAAGLLLGYFARRFEGSSDD